MIWWRGNGLWIGLLAGIPVFAIGKLGATHLAIPYAVSAVLIYLLRDWIGRDSALFSIPTRFWPPLLLAVSLLVQFTPPRQPAEENDAQKAVAELRASLPRMLDKQIRMDRADYDDNTLHYYATSTVSFDDAEAQQAAFERQVRKYYCEDSKKLWQSNVSIAFKLSVPPRSLNDRVETYALTLHPKECQGTSA
jgi:hypothetical protein